MLIEVDTRNKERVTRPSLSIVIPVYKNYHMLDRCIESIDPHNVTIEVIIVDDTPNEEKQTIDLNRFDVEFQIRLFVNKRNRGVTYSRNKGYRLSIYDYVVFLDSDDMLVQDAIINISNEIIMDDVLVALFRTKTKESFFVGSRCKRKVYYDSLGLLETYSLGECLVVVKRVSNARPFIGFYRGHELAGVLRFCNRIRHKKYILISEFVARVYMDDNIESISKGDNLRHRMDKLACGHMYVLKTIYLRKGIGVLFFTWGLRYLYRKSQAILYRYV
jgi:glycosyltransferase involved in cell wall biosynthesis